MSNRTPSLTPEQVKAAERETWTEKQFDHAVTELAQSNGWLTHHQVQARTNKGWRSTVRGDPGFPDRVFVRAGVLIFAELKVGNNTPTDHQAEWIGAINACGVPCFVWCPGDWDQIVEILT